MSSTGVTVVRSIFRSGLFNDKVAIVTGGGTGIGKAIAQELLALGCKVMIASRNVERLQTAVGEMRSMTQGKSHAEIDHTQCNIRKEDQVKNLISTTLHRYGKLDFLVNNGGGQYLTSLADIQTKGWNAVIETNLTGTFLCCREAYNQWMKDNGGSIINIIVSMKNGFPMMSHSGAARAAVENLTKSMAIEWAENGVTVNAVAPGSFIYSDTAAKNYGDIDIFQRTTAVNPAKRIGNPEEISAVVCFLLSSAAKLISGDTITVDGGCNLYRSLWNVPDHKKNKPFSWKDDESLAETKSKL